jgi:hypothetical protein
MFEWDRRNFRTVGIVPVSTPGMWAVFTTPDRELFTEPVLWFEISETNMEDDGQLVVVRSPIVFSADSWGTLYNAEDDDGFLGLSTTASPDPSEWESSVTMRLERWAAVERDRIQREEVA